MAYRTALRFTIIAVCFALISSCGIAPSAKSTNSNNNASVKAPIWKAIPLDITARPSNKGEGWTDYAVRLAIENQGGYGTIPTGDSGIVVTQDRTSYSVVVKVFGKHYQLPGGFRTISSNDIQAEFSAASLLKPIELQLRLYGNVDLTQIQKPVFPTDLPKSNFRNLENPLDFPGKVKMDFRNPRIGSNLGNRSCENCLFIDLEVENYSRSADSGMPVSCLIIDGGGNIREIDLPPSIGPGLTKQYTVVTSFVDKFGGSRPVDASTAQSLARNAKLICQGFWLGENEEKGQLFIYNLD